jgi:hypothetical protein
MKKNIFFTALFAAITGLALFSCAGDKGAPGAPGAGLISVSFQDSVYPTAEYAGTRDAYINSSLPAANFGTDLFITAGWSSSQGAEFRGLISFDTSYIMPSNVKVKEAYLTLHVDTSSSGSAAVMAFALTRGFLEAGVSWNAYDGINTWTNPGAAGDYNTIPISNSQEVDPGKDTVVFTLDNSFVANMLQNPGQYPGIILKASQLSGENTAVFYSRDYGIITKNPKLSVFYVLP